MAANLKPLARRRVMWSVIRLTNGTAASIATTVHWAAVRTAWDEAVARGGGGVRIGEEAENGSVTGPTLMELADEVWKVRKTLAAAIAEAREAIREETA